MAWRSLRWLFLLVLLLFLLSMALPTPLMWGVLFSRTNTQQVSLHFLIVAAAVSLCCADQFSSTNLYEVFVYGSKSKLKHSLKRHLLVKQVCRVLSLFVEDRKMAKSPAQAQPTSSIINKYREGGMQIYQYQPCCKSVLSSLPHYSAWCVCDAYTISLVLDEKTAALVKLASFSFSMLVVCGTHAWYRMQREGVCLTRSFEQVV